jgi:hypothetical protein
MAPAGLDFFRVLVRIALLGDPVRSSPRRRRAVSRQFVVLVPTAIASGVLFALSGGLLWRRVLMRARHWAGGRAPRRKRTDRPP